MENVASDRTIFDDAIFIAHASEDRTFVEKLAERLRGDGFNIWYQRDMKVAENFLIEIDIRLSKCRAGIVVWSKKSVAKRYVVSEALKLLERNRLVPIFKEECLTHVVFSIFQGVNCDEDGNLPPREYASLCESLRRKSALADGEENAGAQQPLRRSNLARWIRLMRSQPWGRLAGALVLGLGLGFGVTYRLMIGPKEEIERFNKAIEPTITEPEQYGMASKYPYVDGELEKVFEVIPPYDPWAIALKKDWKAIYKIQFNFAEMYCRKLKTFRDWMTAPNPRALITTTISKAEQAPRPDDGLQTQDRVNIILENVKQFRCPTESKSSSPT